MRRSGKKILIAILWLIVSTVSATRIEAATGVRFNLTLASLVALSLFMDIYEALFLGIVAILLTNWFPALTREMVLYPVFAAGVVLVRRMFPLKLWLNAAAAAFLAIVIFSLIVAYRAALAVPDRVIADALAGAFLAGIVFQCMAWIYHEEHTRRRM